MEKRDVENLVRWPGAFLAATALLEILFSIGLTLSMALSDLDELVNRILEEVAPGSDVDIGSIELMTPLNLGFELVSLALALVIVAGGISMMNRRRWGLCMTAAILAIFPCTSPCCCLGLPVGVWALVVLLRPEVKAAMKG